MAKSKWSTAARQALQGGTFGFSDEIIDTPASLYAALLTGQKYGDVLKDARQMSREDLAADWKDNPKTATAANILASLLTGKASGSMVKNPWISSAAQGALSGVGSADDTGASRITNGLIGGGFGLGGQAIASGLSRAAKGASDLIPDNVKQQIGRLKEKGIPVRASQALDSKFLTALDRAIANIPLTGAAKDQESQRKAFTRALSETFGENSDIIDSDVLGAAKSRLGSEYERILKDKVIPIDRKEFAQKISEVLAEVGKTTDENGVAFLTKQVDNILGTIDKGDGQLTGEAYQKLRQTLKEASKNNFIAKPIKDFLDNAIRQSADGDIAQQLSNTDTQYKAMKIAEKMFGQTQNSSGIFKPETLYNAAKPSISNLGSGGGGDLGQLARDARLLKPTIPDSGTVSNAVGQGVLGGAGMGALFSPKIAAGAAGVVGTGYGLNKLMGSDYIINGMHPLIQQGAQAIEKSGLIPSALRTGQNSLLSASQGSKLSPVQNEGKPWEDFQARVPYENGKPWEDFR